MEDGSFEFLSAIITDLLGRRREEEEVSGKTRRQRRNKQMVFLFSLSLQKSWSMVSIQYADKAEKRRARRQARAALSLCIITSGRFHFASIKLKHFASIWFSVYLLYFAICIIFVVIFNVVKCCRINVLHFCSADVCPARQKCVL